MSSTPEAATEVINNALAFFVNDMLPSEEAREWAETKMQELAEVPFDVLFGSREDGSIVVDPDYAGGVLLAIQANLRHYQRLEHKSARLERMRKDYRLLTPPARVVLDGKMGEGAQMAFLQGAAKMIEVMMDAELLQRELVETIPDKTEGES